MRSRRDVDGAMVMRLARVWAARRDAIRAVAGAGAVAASGAWARGALASDPSVGVEGWPAVRLLDGETLRPEQLRGSAVVLVFWATYCPFCLRHNAHVDALHRASAGRPLRVLTAALDRDPQTVRAYMRRNGYSFPVTLDAEPLRTALQLRRVIPLTCTFDRSGRPLQRIAGEMFEEDVVELRRLADG
jgi:hypothetical protein